MELAPRIVHVDLSPVWRGGQQQMLFLASSLRRLGQSQAVVARPGPVTERLTAEGFTVLPPGGRARRYARHAAIVHAHDGHAHTWALLVSLAPARPRRILTRRVAFPIRGAASRWKYRNTDLVIAVSEFVRQQVVAAGVRAEHTVVIPDGVEMEMLATATAARAATRARLELGEREQALVCVGALTPEKGTEDLLGALPRLPERCHVIFTGEGQLRSALAQQAAAQGLLSRVHFVAEDGLDPALWVAAADLFVMPSRQEGLGSAALMAMALGVPVVATAAGGIPEIVEDRVTGLLAPPRGTAALAAACDELLRGPKMAAGLAAAAQAAVAKRFAMDRIAAQTLAAYDRLTARSVPA